MRRECTYCLTDDAGFGSIDAAGKHSKGQSRVETEVEKHMPSLPTDTDCAAKRDQESKELAGKYHTPQCFVFHHKASLRFSFQGILPISHFKYDLSQSFTRSA